MKFLLRKWAYTSAKTNAVNYADSTYKNVKRFIQLVETNGSSKERSLVVPKI